MTAHEPPSVSSIMDQTLLLCLAGLVAGFDPLTPTKLPQHSGAFMLTFATSVFSLRVSGCTGLLSRTRKQVALQSTRACLELIVGRFAFAHQQTTVGQVYG